MPELVVEGQEKQDTRFPIIYRAIRVNLQKSAKPSSFWPHTYRFVRSSYDDDRLNRPQSAGRLTYECDFSFFSGSGTL